MAVKIDGLFHIAGVMSWSQSCAIDTNPSVFTDVAFFNSWIESVIN